MSGRARTITMVGLLVVAGGALALSVGNYLRAHSGVEPEFDQTVLCDSCGYLGEMKLSQVDLGVRKTFSPDFGPGAACPQCKKMTLYVNPVVCENCDTSFLMSRSRSGAAVAKCPKCAWTR